MKGPLGDSRTSKGGLDPHESETVIIARADVAAGFADRMLDFDGLDEVIGTPEMLSLGRRYESGRP